MLIRVWDTADRLGHSQYFQRKPGGAITDDHIPLIEYGIPTIDIIDFRPDTSSGFPPEWHTVNDTFDIIDPATIKAVGETISEFVYSY